MNRFRHMGSIALVALVALSASGCSYIQYLPFLKSPVDTRPRGASSTSRGPAFGSGQPGTTAVNPATDWPAYNNDPASLRFSPLAQITTANVASLIPVCRFATAEQTPMQSGPIVVAGVMYLTSARNTYAVDAATCALRWKHTYAYSPKPDYDLKTNRGVAYLDTPDGPRLFRGANDGRVYAMDARTGEEVWNVLAGDVKKGETFPASPVAWHGLVYIGNAGGDNFAVTGRMMAFDARTGARVWSFDLVPRNGPANETWPAETDEVPRGGGTTWTSYTIDTVTGTIYIPTGNAAPDFLQEVRDGDDLYTYSVVGLDARTGALQHVYQLLKRDFHDWDVASAPLLVTTRNHAQIVAEAGKDGHLYGVDRASGRIMYSTPITTLLNGATPLTEAGTRFCPGVQGGVEWNGPAYSAATNMLYVGAVDWCSTVRVDPPSKLKNKLGIPWTGSAKLISPFGVMDSLDRRRGWLTAIDADDGSVKWRYASATPIVAGVTSTAGGVLFAADLNGNVLGFDERTGAMLFRYNTGQPIGGGVISYSANGKQYVAIASGLDAPMTWQTKSSDATVVVLGLR
ncbi:MAG: PQQ-binding-like beta-propeller repeat protein [Gemmatimonadota bacterium]|nr:PQQ-binding-like beta-propeller repeat protein [Gemmatimonadota bacterium]